MKPTNPLQGEQATDWVPGGLCNRKPFFPEYKTISERAQLGVTFGEHGTGDHITSTHETVRECSQLVVTCGEHRTGDHITSTCPIEGPPEGRHAVSETVDRLPVVTSAVKGYTKVEIRQPEQGAVVAGRGGLDCALSSGHSLVILTHVVEMI